MTICTDLFRIKMTTVGMESTVGTASAHFHGTTTTTEESQDRSPLTGPAGGRGPRRRKVSANHHFGVLFVAIGMTAFAAGRADADLVDYSFTATDGVNVGSGTFSYDTEMSGFTFSSTGVDYSPSAGQALVTIDFTSPVGTFFSSLSGSVVVWNDDPSDHDKVQIGVDSPTGGGFASDAILFSNDADAAFSSTALPDSYNLASFPNFHELEYFDPSIQDYRFFTITSLESAGSVPEPTSLLMLGTSVVGLLGYMRSRKVKVLAFAV